MLHEEQAEDDATEKQFSESFEKRQDVSTQLPPLAHMVQILSELAKEAEGCAIQGGVRRGRRRSSSCDVARVIRW